MHSSLKHTALLALLLCSAACTQQPAQVDMRGQNVYVRKGDFAAQQIMYNSDQGFHSQAIGSKSPYQPAPVYTNTPRAQFVSQDTYQDVYQPPVHVSDLSAPGKPGSGVPFGGPTPAPANAPSAAAAAPSAGGSPFSTPAEQGTNPWTKKPRSDAQEETSSKSVELVGEEPAPVAQAAPAAAESKAAFMWPVSSKKVLSGFGPKGSGQVNDGINIAMNTGDPVWAAADGEVAYIGNDMKGYGNMVILKHAGNKSTTYAHLSRSTVDKYDRVKQGDIIGYVGSSGNVSKPQLHFAVRQGKDAVDPQKVLSAGG